MTELYLVDKSALARVPRQASVRAALERLDEIGVLATTAIIDLEIGYSARNLGEFDSVAADRAELYQELPLTRAVTGERVPVFVEVEVAVPHLSPAEW